MRNRIIVFLAFTVLQIALTLIAFLDVSDWLAELVVFSLYGLLSVYEKISLPVFAKPSGIFPDPSLLGWCLFVVTWLVVWFIISCLLVPRRDESRE
jgi:hypothetical protein